MKKKSRIFNTDGIIEVKLLKNVRLPLSMHNHKMTMITRKDQENMFCIFGGKGINYENFHRGYLGTLIQYCPHKRVFGVLHKCDSVIGKRDGHTMHFRPWTSIINRDVKEFLSHQDFQQGEIIVFGGYSFEKRRITNDLFSFDLGLQQWTELHFKNPPPRVSLHCSLYSKLRDELIVFGGKLDEDEERSNDLYICDFGHSKWKRVPIWGEEEYDYEEENDDFGEQHSKKMKEKNAPSPRSGCSMNWVNEEEEEEFVIFGGYSNLKFQNDLWIFKLKERRWYPISLEGEIPLPRSSHISFVYDSHLGIFGGNGGRDRWYNDMFCFDLEKNVFKKIAIEGDIPTGRRNMTGGLFFIEKTLLLKKRQKENEKEEEEEEEEEEIKRKYLKFVLIGGRGKQKTFQNVYEFNLGHIDISRLENQKEEKEKLLNIKEENEKLSNLNEILRKEMTKMKKKIISLQNEVDLNKNDNEEKSKKIQILEKENKSFKNQVIFLLQEIGKNNTTAKKD